MVSRVSPSQGTGTLYLLAITGSLGCGKSRVSRWLAEQGAHRLDADQDARAVLAPGGPGWQAVVDHFGPVVLSKEESGSQPAIDRRVLGEIVFRDAGARVALEAMLHPRIYARQALALARWQQETPAGTTAIVVDEVPLLFETDGAQRFDWTVAVLCGGAQGERLQDRTGMSAAVQQAVIARQMSEPEKKARARQSIDNSGPWEETVAQLHALWQQVRHQAGSVADPAWPNRWPEGLPDGSSPIDASRLKIYV